MGSLRGRVTKMIPAEIHMRRNTCLPHDTHDENYDRHFIKIAMWSAHSLFSLQSFHF